MKEPLILVTNDDGWESPGLLELKRAMETVGRVEVIAPDVNRSGVARSITTHGHLHVEEVRLADGSTARTTDGTPVDCVRFASLGLVGEPPDVVVSGVNMGPNLGDDVTYSGTVAAAIEGNLLGIPSIAVSQDALLPVDTQDAGRYDFTAVAGFAARLVPLLLGEPGLRTLLLNVNGPGLPPDEIMGARITHLGRRIYNAELSLVSREGARGRYMILQNATYEDDEGSDFHALERGEISVTPLRFDLTDTAGMDTLRRLDLADLLGAAPRAGGPEGPARRPSAAYPQGDPGQAEGHPS